MPARDPIERTIISRIGAHTRWARCDDMTAATAIARKAQLDRFETQVDPDGTLDPEERARRAESAKKAYYARLGLMSVQARRARKLADQLTAEVDAAMAADTTLRIEGEVA